MSNGTEEPLDPVDWFHVKSDQIVSDFNQSTWPWMRVTQREFAETLVLYENYVQYYSGNVTQKIMWTFCALGIVGGCLIVATIVRMPESARTNFYKITNLIAVLDLLFLIDIVVRKRLLLEPNRSLAITVLMFITSGSTFCFGLMSDLLTLALSAERFLALTFPTRYKQVRKITKRRLWIVTILLSAVISLCRARYAFGNALYTIRSVTDTDFFRFLTYFSDMVLPILLGVFMILTAIGILRALIRRTWSKMIANNHIVRKHIHDCMKTMSLLAVLMALFQINQFGCIYYEVVYLRRDNAKLTFHSDLAQVREFLGITIDLELWGNASTVIEAAQKSFPFYTYIMFSANFRHYFLVLIRVRPMIELGSNAVMTLRKSAQIEAGQQIDVKS